MIHTNAIEARFANSYSIFAKPYLMSHSLRRTTVLVLLAMFLSPTGAWGWSEGGHHLIAVIAFKLLSKTEQEQLVAILEKHPRFKEDFTPPEGLPNDEEKLHWRIGRAAYWPDVARRQPTYHRSTWHYELGSALVIGDKDKVKEPQRPGALPKNATMQTQELYISQALELCKQTLGNQSSSAEDRALALCWIGHLVGDAHQPCHAGSLYMEGVFAESDGDRGANRILTKQRKNMHALWDQLLGDQFALDSARRRNFEITSDEELVRMGQQAIAAPEGLDPQTWLAESRKLAVENVYTPEVMTSLELVTRGIVKEPQEIELSEAFLKNAGRVAQVRAIQSGYRLAETWRNALKEAAK